MAVSGTQKRSSKLSPKALRTAGLKPSANNSQVARSVAFDSSLKELKKKEGAPSNASRGKRSKLALAMKASKLRSARVSDELFKLADERGAFGFRSAPKTIELWAKIGAFVERTMTSEDLAALANNELEVKLERKTSQPISVSDVLKDLRFNSKDSAWRKEIIQSELWYEESPNHPGFLIRVNSKTGERALGNSKNGIFKMKKILAPHSK